MITTENYELYFLQYMENRLDEEGRIAVEAFVSEHPDLAEEMELYAQSPRLTADESIVYADKQSLKHPVGVAAPQAKTWWRWTAAAAVVAIAVPLALNIWQPKPSVPQVAELRPEKVLERHVPTTTTAVVQTPVANEPMAKTCVSTTEPKVTDDMVEMVIDNTEFGLEEIAVEPMAATERYAAIEPDQEQSEMPPIPAIAEPGQYAEQSEIQPAEAEARLTLREAILAELAERYEPSSEQIERFAEVTTRAVVGWTTITKAYEKFRETISITI